LIAGYGLRVCLIAQDLSQIHAAYGHDESITSNCNTRVAFTPNRIETARWISAMAGETTVRHSHRTVTNTGATISEPEIARSMMTPDEVMRMSENEGLIFTSGHPAIRATKLRYFREPLFIERARIAPPPQSDRIIWPSSAPPMVATTGPAGPSQPAVSMPPPSSPEMLQPGPTGATAPNGSAELEQAPEQGVLFLKKRTSANGKASDEAASTKAGKLL
jgi:type IV secretion system protein VirD4